MGNTKYTYAVARIRALETSLLTDAVIEQLLGCSTAEQALQLLTDRGWGDVSPENGAESVLRCEEEKTWKVIRDVAPDMSVFDVLACPRLYHNLKAAVKAVCTGNRNLNIFYDGCSVSGEEMMQIIERKEFERLPGNLPRTAREAFDILLHTGDGQLCDICVDKAALEAVMEAGKRSGEKIIEEYADTAVAVADIKIAVRSWKTGKSADFMSSAMAECRSLNTGRLIRAALAGKEEIVRYLLETSYAGGAEALKESPSAFERWCDNQIIETMKPQKYEAFSVGPLLGYLLARENEIRTVRIILTGKQNGFPDDAIRERIREMYV